MLINGIKPSKPKCECSSKPKKEPKHDPPPLPYYLDNHTNYIDSKTKNITVKNNSDVIGEIREKKL